MSGQLERLPAIDGYSLLAEWQPVARCWMAWPRRVATWGGLFEHAGLAAAALARAIADVVPVTMLVPPGLEAEILLQLERRADVLPYGLDDAWVGDFGPLFLANADGGLAAARCRFNGWGNRLHGYDADDGFAAWLLQQTGIAQYDCPLTLEAGALQGDGQGTLLAARNVLLNANRNPTVDQRQVEDLLALYLGVRKVIWLDGPARPGAGNGQLAPVARFAAPGQVICAVPGDLKLPYADLLAGNLAQLAAATDALGRPLEVIEMPLPDSAEAAAEGGGLPSYLDFRIVNDAVLLPVFGDRTDAAATATLSRLFASRRTLALEMGVLGAAGAGLRGMTLAQPAGGERNRRLP